MIRRRTLNLFLLAALVAAGPGGAQELATAVEAEFIERFTRFIEWPTGSTVANPDTPFIIGVLGEDDIREAFEKLAETTRIKGKRLEVKQIGDLGAVTGCQVVFIGAAWGDRLDEVVRKVRGNPVLTVSDTPGYARRGVMVNFTQKGDFIRFEINRAAAEASRLRLAPELIQLGIPVD